jgi:hypothetical protein
MNTAQRIASAKVFCAECRYLSVSTSSVVYCRHPHAEQIQETWRERTIIRTPPGERNAENDCRDFAPQTFLQRWQPWVIIGACWSAFALLLLVFWKG